MAKYKFKLLAGRHSINIGTDAKPEIKRYGMGDIVETDQELDKLFNSRGSTKFERLAYEEPDTLESLAEAEANLAKRKAALLTKKDAPVEPKSQSDDLSKLTLPELQEIANSNGIELGRAKTKDEVLKVVKAALVTA
jgi:hypothetical protein